MKRIRQLFIFLATTLSFVAVAFWWECDSLDQSKQQAEQTYNNCLFNHNHEMTGCEQEYSWMVYAQNQADKCHNVETAKSNCTDIAGQISLNNVDYVEKRDWYCCFNGGAGYDSDNSCSLLDSINQKKEQCPDIADEINWDNVDYVKVNDWSCCFWGEGMSPQCECNNQPQNWQCKSWFKLDWNCCVAIPCEELNSWDKEKCDARRKNWGAVIWENCECVCDPARWCCGVQLNVPLPFIGDCIEMTTNNSIAGDRDWSISVNQLNAFPVLIKWISKIVVTLIMIFSIIVVICAWIMMTTSVASQWNFNKWLDMLKKVIVALILLWVSWLILRLINPSFFGG